MIILVWLAPWPATYNVKKGHGRGDHIPLPFFALATYNIRNGFIGAVRGAVRFSKGGFV